MRSWLLALWVVIVPLAVRAGGADDPARFDGDWTTTVSCPDSDGALGYVFDVPTLVKAGVLHGERMKPGEAGYLVLDGQIGADGHAELIAKGLVGAAPFAVGARPAGTGYGYHVTAQFDGAHGTGSRVEGRRCDLTFVRR